MSAKRSKIPKLSKVYKEMIIAGRGNDSMFREYLLLREKEPIGMHDHIIERIKQYLDMI